MGQYYKVAIKQDGEIKVSDRKVKGVKYVMAQLMEHSYIGNYLTNAVSKAISGKPARIAWVGDYADEDVAKATNGELSYDEVWCDGVDDSFTFPAAKRFSYRGKWLVNHDKKVCISFNAYMKKADKEWPIFPLSILTAIGNGNGGGDYSGNAMARAGSWAWDLVEITKAKPAGYEVLDFAFVEGPKKDED